jgi:hypothetical protein
LPNAALSRFLEFLRCRRLADFVRIDRPPLGEFGCQLLRQPLGFCSWLLLLSLCLCLFVVPSREGRDYREGFFFFWW